MRDTCVDQFFNRVSKYPELPAYFANVEGEYVPTTWKQYGKNVTDLALGFIALGLAKGQCVVTLSFNRPEWVAASMAAQAAGGVCVGIYNSCSAEEVEYILKHSEAPILVLENGKRWREQVEPIVQHVQSLKHIILIEPDDIVQDGLVKTFSQVLEMGKKQPPTDLNDRINSLDVNDTATFIYTSGTTGAPKAVELSHKAVDWTVASAVKLLKVRKEDSLVSYLPLAHVAEKMFTIYTPIYSGMKIYFADSVENMPENLKVVQPTIFFGVPRVYEKFHEKVSEKLKSATGARAILLKWARSVAMKHWEYDHKNALIPPLVSVQYALAKHLVFNKLKPLLGLGNARACISGAAPIAVDIIKFFMSIDVPIYEVYGQSEDCGPTTFNLPKATKLGTVGRALPGVEMKIAADGEIVVRGPHLFKGYYKDEAATMETMDDGWLCTGDVGEIDREGFLRITDRKKDLLITAGGKNISPQNIESLLKQIPLVSLAVVAGDKQKYLVALLTPNYEGLEKFATQMAIKYVKIEELIMNKLVNNEIQMYIEKINKKLANVEQIKKFLLLPKDFTIEDGELTPTMKIKRKVINLRYQSSIESLYGY